jgi:hypothetical protein
MIVIRKRQTFDQKEADVATSTSTIALKVADLKKELQRAEAEAVAKTTPLSRLRDAEADLNEARRKLAINEAQGAELVTAHERAVTYRNSLHPNLERRAAANGAAAKLEGDIHAMQVEREKLETEVRSKQQGVFIAKNAIAEHPVYIEVRERQRQLVAEAARVVDSIFQTPLYLVSRVIEEAETLAQRESSLIGGSVRELVPLGLPEVPRLLTTFFGQTIPHQLISSVLAQKGGVLSEIERLRELAERPFLG